jgi:3-methyladenine DNA glycosylase/8-oxoguanine DNA glycosylase
VPTSAYEGLLSLKEAYSVEFEAVPPYNFELTVHKPAGWWWSTPNEIFEDGALWTATRLNSTAVGLKLKSVGTVQKPRVRCGVFAREKMRAQDEASVTRIVKRALRTEEDISEFYALARKDDVLKAVVEELYGMHTVSWPELFPALILAVTLQMAPMKRSNQMMELLLENFGEQVRFDGKALGYWPSPEKVAALSVDELRAKAKLGYRAQNLVSIAKAMRAGFPTIQQLWEMAPVETKKKLLNLRGIGEYSAEIIMPSMGFPLDVWSAKIFHILFYGTEPENARKSIMALKQTAEERWDKWKGYAFVYVLNDLPRISARIGVDLTKF